jgi:hypothetical protein
MEPQPDGAQELLSCLVLQPASTLEFGSTSQSTGVVHMATLVIGSKLHPYDCRVSDVRLLAVARLVFASVAVARLVIARLMASKKHPST